MHCCAFPVVILTNSKPLLERGWICSHIREAFWYLYIYQLGQCQLFTTQTQSELLFNHPHSPPSTFHYLVSLCSGRHTQEICPCHTCETPAVPLAFITVHLPPFHAELQAAESWSRLDASQGRQGPWEQRWTPLYLTVIWLPSSRDKTLRWPSNGMSLTARPVSSLLSLCCCTRRFRLSLVASDICTFS